jgi:DNA-binding GntR family transcriptional regulator
VRRLPRLAAPTSLADEVHDRLRSWILDAIPVPGERLNVDALARDLDVSPTPVREALARLESEGLVVRAPRRGWSIAPPLDRDELRDLYHLRLLLEPWAAGEAARRATEADVRRLTTELERCPEAPADGSFSQYRSIVDHDSRFHGLLLDLAGSPAVHAAFDHTHCHLHVFRVAYGPSMGADALAEHRAIVQAVAEGDGRGATRAMRAHLHRSLERVEGALAGAGDAP